MRLSALTSETMSAHQRDVHDESVAGKRGRMPAPLAAWLHSPELGRHAQRLGAFLRYDTVLEPRLSELAILVTARHWTSHYEWYVHKRDGLKAGIPASVVAEIAARRAPRFEDAESQLVYDYAVTLQRDRTISPDLHERATAILGERGVVELVGLLGYYTLVAMTLNAFDIGPPEGEPLELGT